MAEYKVVDAEQLDADLTEMADEVRILTDTSDTMAIDEITSNIAQANADISIQADIIAQIKTALEGKASGGGGGGTEITAGFTSEKYKKWLEINGYTIVNFTLTSQATADFIINHPLGRTAKSIICFRADLDSEPNDKRIGFAVSLDGSTADTMTNRLVIYNNTYMTFAFGIRIIPLDYRAILENTTEHIKLRYVQGGAHGLVWASGDYCLAVL